MSETQENGTNGADSETIEMSDGKSITFAGKRKMVKKPEFDASGKFIGVRFYFRFEVSDAYPDNTLFFERPKASHTVTKGDETHYGTDALMAMGALQKFGDAAAGQKGTPAEDMFEEVRDAVDQFNSGVWSERREASGLAGTSILLRAMVEDGKSRGKTVADARALLKTLDAATKLSLRNSPRLKPIVERLEADKVSRKGKSEEAAKVLEGW